MNEFLLLLLFLFRNDLESSFVVQCTGHIDGGDFEDNDYLYCRYVFTQGNDWEIIGGLESGLSQTSCKNALASESDIIWNFPIDVTFKSTNVFGWPRIAISVYGIDYFGRDVIRGYGSALIPLKPGIHQITVDMFSPVSNSSFNDFVSWVLGNPPEV